MKQEKNIESKAKCQNRKASPLPLQRRGDWEQRRSFDFNYGQQPYKVPVPTPSEGGNGGGFGKGPPGRSRSPDKARGRPPAEKADKPDNKAGPTGNNTSYINVF